MSNKPIYETVLNLLQGAAAGVFLWQALPDRVPSLDAFRPGTSQECHVVLYDALAIPACVVEETDGISPK